MHSAGRRGGIYTTSLGAHRGVGLVCCTAGPCPRETASLFASNEHSSGPPSPTLPLPSPYTAVVPNGIVTGLDIGFSNKSLVFINLSFYTMCKSTVPVFLLFFAFVWGIEKWVPAHWFRLQGDGSQTGVVRHH